MGAITDWLRNLSGPAVYVVVFLLVFAEDALFVGFVLPGETAAVLGGVIAGTSHSVQLWLMVLIVVVAAILGDSTGYEIGRRFGPRLLETGPARKHADRVEKARSLIQRRGPVAVFLGRFVSFLRAMVPTLAGVSELPYLRFLAFNAAGGLVWGIGFTLLGYLAGNAYQRIERVAGTVAAIVVGAVVVAAAGVWAWRRHRAGKPSGTAEREETERSPAAAAPEARTDGSEADGDGTSANDTAGNDTAGNDTVRAEADGGTAGGRAAVEQRPGADRSEP